MPNPFRAGRLRCILRIPVGIAFALALAELVVRQTYWCPMVQDPDFGAIVQPGATVRWTTEGNARSRWTERGMPRCAAAARIAADPRRWRLVFSTSTRRPA
jgi:hypothetical protein